MVSIYGMGHKFECALKSPIGHPRPSESEPPWSQASVMFVALQKLLLRPKV